MHHLIQYAATSPCMAQPEALTLTLYLAELPILCNSHQQRLQRVSTAHCCTLFTPSISCNVLSSHTCTCAATQNLQSQGCLSLARLLCESDSLFRLGSGYVYTTQGSSSQHWRAIDKNAKQRKLFHVTRPGAKLATSAAVHVPLCELSNRVMNTLVRISQT